MDLVHALEGLDARSWTAVSHAYGGADDLPDVVRALAGDDADAADEAVSELYDSVLHQGTVYAASAEVAPFLARIAAAGHKAADVLALLGGMAGSEDEHGVAPGTVRGAVAAQLPLLLPLLSADDAGVRQAAAWAVARTGAGETVLPALHARWDRETEPLVRAELLGALSRLDPAGASGIAQTALDATQPAPLRIAAVFACLDAGVRWGTPQHTAVLSLLPADPLVAERLDLDRNEPLAAVVGTLLRRDTDEDRAAAGDLLEAALLDGRPGVRKEAVWAAERACTLSRSAPERLIPALLRLAADAAAAQDVLSLLANLGPAAAAAQPALARFAAADPDGDADLADRALAALALVAPVQAAPVLARDLGRRPRALDAAAGFRAPADSPFPFDASLLTAIRARLTDADLKNNEPMELVRLLRQWGPQAAPALPELYAALPRFPHPTAPAIAEIAATLSPEDRDRAANALRSAADDAPREVAPALYALTGGQADLTRLLAVLAQELSAGRHVDVTEAARVAGTLGTKASSLVPALQAALNGTDGPHTSPELDADTAVAAALWQTTKDAGAVVPVLDSVFLRATGEPWFRWTVVRAARATALLGPAGRPLVPRLEPLLDEPAQAPAAVLALLSVAERDSLDRRALADTVLKSAEQEAALMEACDALAALGSAALGPDHTRRLTDLAERDLRVVRSGLENQIIRGDDGFRRRVREVLAEPGGERTARSGPLPTG